MGLNVFYHFRPVVVSFDPGIGFSYTKMAVHLLEDSFDKGLWDDSGFIFLATFPVNVVQQTFVVIPISNPFMEPTPRIFHQFGNSDAMFIRLLQSFCVGQFNLTQWAAVLTYLNLGFIYGDILTLQGVVISLPGCKG